MKGLIVSLVVVVSLVSLVNSESAMEKAMSAVDNVLTSVARLLGGPHLIAVKVTDSASLNQTSKGTISFDTFPVGARDYLDVSFGDAKAAVQASFVSLRIVASGKSYNKHVIVRPHEKLTLVLAQVVDFAAFEVGPLPEELVVNVFVKEVLIQTFPMSQLRPLFSDSQDFSPAEMPAQLKTLAFECPTTKCSFNKMEIVNKGTYNLVIDNFMVGFENFAPTIMIETIPALDENDIYIPAHGSIFGHGSDTTTNTKDNKGVKSPINLPVAIGASVGGLALLSLALFGGKVAFDKKKKKGAKLVLIGAEFGGTADDVENYTDDKTDIGDEEFAG